MTTGKLLGRKMKERCGLGGMGGKNRKRSSSGTGGDCSRGDGRLLCLSGTTEDHTTEIQKCQKNNWPLDSCYCGSENHFFVIYFYFRAVKVNALMYVIHWRILDLQLSSEQRFKP